MPMRSRLLLPSLVLALAAAPACGGSTETTAAAGASGPPSGSVSSSGSASAGTATSQDPTRTQRGPDASTQSPSDVTTSTDTTTGPSEDVASATLADAVAERDSAMASADTTSEALPEADSTSSAQDSSSSEEDTWAWEAEEDSAEPWEWDDDVSDASESWPEEDTSTSWPEEDTWGWDDDTADATGAGSLVEVLFGEPELSTLVAALQAAGLMDTLASEGPLTLFAPTNTALAQALSALCIDVGELLANTELLTNILTYHLVDGALSASDLLALAAISWGTEISTLQGEELTLQLNDGMLQINDAFVTTADIMADNGVIHVIDAVLIPDDALWSIPGCPGSESDASSGSGDASTDEDVGPEEDSWSGWSE